MQLHDTPQAALQGIVQLFNHLQPNDLQRLHQFYSDDAQFKDPFNEVQGLAAIQGIFEHMYASLDAPRFVVTQQVLQGSHAFVTWDFLFSIRKRPPQEVYTIRGATHFVLRQEADGWRICVHRDYWDAAEELYEKLPVVGRVMRWLKQRVNA